MPGCRPQRSDPAWIERKRRARTEKGLELPKNEPNADIERLHGLEVCVVDRIAGLRENSPGISDGKEKAQAGRKARRDLGNLARKPIKIALKLGGSSSSNLRRDVPLRNRSLANNVLAARKTADVTYAAEVGTKTASTGEGPLYSEGEGRSGDVSPTDDSELRKGGVLRDSDVGSFRDEGRAGGGNWKTIPQVKVAIHRRRGVEQVSRVFEPRLEVKAGSEVDAKANVEATAKRVLIGEGRGVGRETSRATDAERQVIFLELCAGGRDQENSRKQKQSQSGEEVRNPRGVWKRKGGGKGSRNQTYGGEKGHGGARVEAKERREQIGYAFTWALFRCTFRNAKEDD